MSAVQRLRALLTPEKAWTKGAFARDAVGSSVRSVDPAAVCHCLIGGTLKVTGGAEDYLTTVVRLDRQVQREGRFHNIAQFNDHPDTTHADVLALLDRVLA